MRETSAIKKDKKKALAPNPSNTWQQHPNIKSPDARARAYLIEAGLIQNASKSKKNLDWLDPQIDLINSPEAKFGRLLASPDQRIRHSTIQKLSIYLKKRCDLSNEQGGISELDLMKLWKGLWYTLYLCDKAPVQDDVSKKLCQLLWSFTGTDEEDEYAGRLYLEMEENFGSDDDEEENDNLIDCEEGDVLDDDDDDDDDDGAFMDENDDDEYGDDEVNSEDEDDLDLDMYNIDAEDEEDSDGEDEDNDEDEDEDHCDHKNCSHHHHDTESSIDNLEMKHCRGAHLAALYVRTFFRTIRREWTNMDKYRVDKFYTCMRYMLHEVYTFMSKRHWNLGIIRLFNDTIFEEILSQIPNGPRYHLIDIALEELVHVSAKAAIPLTEATFIDCMEPFLALLQILDDATVHSRIVEKILQRFLVDYSVVHESQTEIQQAPQNEKCIFTQVHVGTVAEFIFDIASNENTQDRYRKVLYETHKQYMKRLKEIGHDVVIESDSNGLEYSEEEEGGVDDDEEELYHNDGKPIDQNGKKVNITKSSAADHKDLDEQSKSKKKGDKKEEKRISQKMKSESSSELKLETAAPQSKTVKDKNKGEMIHQVTTLADKTSKQTGPDAAAKNTKANVQPEKEKETTMKPQQDKMSKVNEKSHRSDKPENGNAKGQSKSTSADYVSKSRREEEKVVTISINEQKAAAKTANLSAKSESVTVELKISQKPGPEVRPTATESNKKKVKFGKQNISKSYSASINDLRKINPKEILEKRPSESILRSPTTKRSHNEEMSKQGKKVKRIGKT